MNTNNYQDNIKKGIANVGNMQKKLIIEKYGDFSFISDKTLGKDIIKSFISSMQDHILKFYLRKMKRFNISDDFTNNIHLIDKEYNEYIDRIRDIAYNIFNDNDVEEITWNMYSQKESLYITMHKENVVNKYIGSIQIIMIFFNNETNVVTVYNFIINANGTKGVQNVVGPLYLSKKDYYVKKVIKDTNVMSIRYLQDNVILMLYEALKRYEKDRNIESLEYSYHKHSSFEINIFKRLIYTSTSSTHFIDIYKMINPKYKSEADKSIEILNKLKDNDKHRSEDVPIVDFGAKEWKFIDKYIDNKGVYQDDLKIIDISDALRYPRYGNDLEFAFSHDGIAYNLITSFKYDETNDIALFIISYNINECMSIFSAVYYKDISSFNPNENILGIETYLMLQSSDCLLKSSEELKELAPLFLDHSGGIIDALMTLVSIHKVLYDKPERSRMIKETRKASVKNTSSNKNNKRKSNVVVKHILLPVKEAKEYISNATGNGEVYREYVTESWKRKGYWRKLPNSDKKIYIEPTICKRHLELSKNKEIHIKL